MIYVAVSVANNCDYCIHSHTASAHAKGMTDAQYSELLAVIGMASADQRPGDRDEGADRPAVPVGTPAGTRTRSIDGLPSALATHGEAK